MKTIVGLYKDMATANQIANELANYNISQDSVSLVTGKVSDDLTDTLIADGVATMEAEAYVEGVRQGGSLVYVQVEDAQTNKVVEIMNRYQPLDIHKQAAMGSKATGQSMSTTKPSTTKQTTTDLDRQTKSTTSEQGDMNIPIVEEELTVGKREVEQGGVRIHTRIEEQPVEQQVSLHKEKVTVERRPVDRATDVGDLNVFKEGTVEVSATSEEAVVEKRARVVEEVVVKKDASEQTETVRDTVRKTKVDVEQTGGMTKTSSTSFDAMPFRTDYQTKYATSGRTFEQYEPAYQYGYTLANTKRYQGSDWNTIEADARRDWTQQHQGSAWEDFKEAVRHGWEQTKNAVSH